MSLTLLAVSVRKHRHILIFKQGRFCKEVLGIPRSATNGGAESELGKKKAGEGIYWALLQNTGVGQNIGRTYGRKGDSCYSSRRVLRSSNK